jgi:hypothetical protein
MPDVFKFSLLFTLIILLLEWHAFIEGNKEYAIQTKRYNLKSYLADVTMITAMLCFTNTSVEGGFVYMQF